MARFLHLGVPTAKRQPGESYFAEMKVFFTDPAEHPYQCEYLRFEADSPMPEDIKKYPHVAYQVGDLAAELAQCEKIVMPASRKDEKTILAFGWRDGVLFEFMETKG